MFFLDQSTKSIQASLAVGTSTVPIPFIAGYADLTSTTFLPLSNEGVLTTSSPVTIVPAPAAGVQRQIKYINISNQDTLGSVVTVAYNNGSVRAMMAITLAIDETLIYDEHNGWQVLTSTGSIKVLETVVSTSGGSTGGTVTSVGLALPGSLFSVTGSPVATTGTLTGSFINIASTLVFAGPSSGASAVPIFRQLSTSDILGFSSSGGGGSTFITLAGNSSISTSTSTSGTTTSTYVFNTGLVLAGNSGISTSTNGNSTFVFNTGGSTGGSGSTFITLAGNGGISTSTSTSGTTTSTYVFNTSTGAGVYLPLAGGTMTGDISYGDGLGYFSFYIQSTYAAADSGFTGVGEWGLQFGVLSTGYVVGGTFFKQPGNTGTHILSLWNYTTTTLLESTTFVNETSSGWQNQLFPTPVAVTPGTAYMIGYSSSTGHNSQTTALGASTSFYGYIQVSTEPSGFNSTPGTMPTVGAPNDYGVDVLFELTSTGSAMTINSTGATVFTPIGSVGSVLTATSTGVTWSTGSGGGGGPFLPLAGGIMSGPIVLSTGATTLYFNNSTLGNSATIEADSSGALTLNSGSDGGTILMDNTVEMQENSLTFDDASEVTADGSGNVTFSGNSYIFSPSTFLDTVPPSSTGKLLTLNSTGLITEFSLGTAGQVLTVLNTSTLTWSTGSGGGGGGGSTFLVLAGNTGISTSTSTSGTTTSTFVFNTYSTLPSTSADPATPFAGQAWFNTTLSTARIADNTALVGSVPLTLVALPLAITSTAVAILGSTAFNSTSITFPAGFWNTSTRCMNVRYASHVSSGGGGNEYGFFLSTLGVQVPLHKTNSVTISTGVWILGDVDIFTSTTGSSGILAFRGFTISNITNDSAGPLPGGTVTGVGISTISGDLTSAMTLVLGAWATLSTPTDTLTIDSYLLTLKQ